VPGVCRKGAARANSKHKKHRSTKLCNKQKGVVNSRPAGQHKTTKGAFAAGMSALADNLLHPMHSHDLLHYQLKNKKEIPQTHLHLICLLAGWCKLL
jgi:hypothetical protein